MTNLIQAVFAQLTPEPSGDVFMWVLQMGKTIVEMFQTGQHGAAVAGMVMLTVFGLRSLLKDRLPHAALPWLSAGLGVMSAVAMQLLALAVGARPTEWLTAVVQGALIGATASGLWSLLGKKLMELFARMLGGKSGNNQPPAQ